MKALPLAIENFTDLIRQGGYYVDKTAFIQPLMTEGKTVRLITRPHCFGKTLFMDMLKSFLQIDWQHPRSAEGIRRFLQDSKSRTIRISAAAIWDSIRFSASVFTVLRAPMTKKPAGPS